MALTPVRYIRTLMGLHRVWVLALAILAHLMFRVKHVNWAFCSREVRLVTAAVHLVIEQKKKTLTLPPRFCKKITNPLSELLLPLLYMPTHMHMHYVYLLAVSHFFSSAKSAGWFRSPISSPLLLIKFQSSCFSLSTTVFRSKQGFEKAFFFLLGITSEAKFSNENTVF